MYKFFAITGIDKCLFSWKIIEELVLSIDKFIIHLKEREQHYKISGM
jgi:hypothetical protein